MKELIEIYSIIGRVYERAKKAAALNPDSTVHNSEVADILKDVADRLTNEVDSLVATTARSRVALQQIMNVHVKGQHTNSFECRKAVIEAQAIMNGERIVK